MKEIWPNLGNNTENPIATFLQGGGEMGQLVRDFDWASSPLGPPEAWPKSLLISTATLLHSNFPMLIWWGNDFIQLYNDAYLPLMKASGKHPKGLGQKGSACWKNWSDTHKRLCEILDDGKAISGEDQPVTVEGADSPRTRYWTYSYTPLFNDEGKRYGVLLTYIDTTPKVENVKRLEESRTHFEFAIKATELGIWDYNMITGEYTVNDRLKDLLGLPHEEILTNEKVLDCVVEEDRSRIQQAAIRSLDFNIQDPYHLDITVQQPGGKRIVVKAKGFASFDENGKPTRFTGTLQDITIETNVRLQLLENQHRIQGIIDNAPFPIGVYEGREMKITRVNKAILEAWGKGSDVIGKTFAEVLPELESQGVYEQLDQVFTTGVPFNVHNRRIELVMNGKPEVFYYSYSYTPLYDTQGKIYGVMNTAANVTEVNLAKIRLEQSEKEIRNMIRQAPVAMSIVRGENLVVEIANELMYALWGHSEEEVLNRPLFDAIPEATDQGFEQILLNVYNTGVRFIAHERIIHLPRNGQLQKVYVNFVCEPLFDSSGQRSGIFTVATDVTTQVMSRKSIEEAEARARLAIKSASLGVYELDLKTGEVVSDERFSQIFGFTSPVERKNYVSIIHPEDLPLRNTALEAALSSGFLEYEVRLLKSGGTIGWVRVRGNVLYDDNKQPAKLLGVVQDITEQMQFAQTLEQKVNERTRELAEANLQLQQNNIELNEFAYIASHDLQEPLRKVRTFTDMLNTSVQEMPDRAKMFLEKIQDSAERMQTLINDVLKFSSLSKERERFQLVNLNRLIKGILTDYELLISQKQAVINIDQMPAIEAIPLQMTQLFSNLISNALKFARQDTRAEINITARKLSQEEVEKYRDLNSELMHYEIAVKDNGIGFEQENASQIFNMFQRLHGKKEYAGTGIGLAICKKIAMNHHGFIYATSAPSEGANFFIILPSSQTL